MSSKVLLKRILSKLITKHKLHSMVQKICRSFFKRLDCHLQTVVGLVCEEHLLLFLQLFSCPPLSAKTSSTVPSRPKKCPRTSILDRFCFCRGENCHFFFSKPSTRDRLLRQSNNLFIDRMSSAVSDAASPPCSFSTVPTVWLSTWAAYVTFIIAWLVRFM